MNPTLRIIKNATANVVRGGASALVALLLPHFLTRSLPPEKFSAWVLALQLAAYVGYVDFGIQTAIARFIAQAVERKDEHRSRQVVACTTLLLVAVMLVAVIGLAVLCYLVPHMYKHVGPATVRELQICIALVGGSLAIGLPGSVFTGTLIGVERNEIPGLIIAASKLGTALSVILAAAHTENLVSLAAITAGFNLLSYYAQFIFARPLMPQLHDVMSLIDRRLLRELIAYCTSLSTWSIGMLLVSGLDLTIVGFIRFNDVACYSIANTLVLFIAGLSNAMFSSLLAPTAAMHARGECERLGQLVVQSTRIAVLSNLLFSLPLICFPRVLLRCWVAPVYVPEAIPLLCVLAIANVLRLTFNPYAVAVQGTGQQNAVIISPLVEGCTNISVSLILGHVLGSLGVAIGTLIGSVVASFWTVLYNIPRTPAIRIVGQVFVKEALLRPSLCFIPAVACTLIASRQLVFWPIAVIGMIATGLLTTHFGGLTLRSRLQATHGVTQAPLECE